jgi:hypothetical protein
LLTKPGGGVSRGKVEFQTMFALNAAQPKAGLLAAATRRALAATLRVTSAAAHDGGEGEAHRESQGGNSESATATKEQVNVIPPTSDGGQGVAEVHAATSDVGEVVSQDGTPGLGGPGAVELKQRLKGSADAEEAMKVQKRS